MAERFWSAKQGKWVSREELDREKGISARDATNATPRKPNLSTADLLKITGESQASLLGAREPEPEKPTPKAAPAKPLSTKDFGKLASQSTKSRWDVAAEEQVRASRMAPEAPRSSIGATEVQNLPSTDLDVVLPSVAGTASRAFGRGLIAPDLLGAGVAKLAGTQDVRAAREALDPQVNPLASRVGTAGGSVAFDAALMLGLSPAARQFARSGVSMAKEGLGTVAKRAAELPFDVKRDALVSAGIGGAMLAPEEEDRAKGLGLAMFSFIPAPGKKGMLSPLKLAIEDLSPKRVHTVKEWMERIPNLKYSQPGAKALPVAKEESAVLLRALAELPGDSHMTRDELLQFGEQHAKRIVEGTAMDRVRSSGQTERVVHPDIADLKKKVAANIQEMDNLSSSGRRDLAEELRLQINNDLDELERLERTVGSHTQFGSPLYTSEEAPRGAGKFTRIGERYRETHLSEPDAAGGAYVGGHFGEQAVGQRYSRLQSTDLTDEMSAGRIQQDWSDGEELMLPAAKSAQDIVYDKELDSGIYAGSHFRSSVRENRPGVDDLLAEQERLTAKIREQTEAGGIPTKEEREAIWERYKELEDQIQAHPRRKTAILEESQDDLANDARKYGTIPKQVQDDILETRERAWGEVRRLGDIADRKGMEYATRRYVEGVPAEELRALEAEVDAAKQAEAEAYKAWIVLDEATADRARMAKAAVSAESDVGPELMERIRQRRFLQDAAERRVDEIGMTTAQEQMRRYGTDTIEFNPTTREIIVKESKHPSGPGNRWFIPEGQSVEEALRNTRLLGFEGEGRVRRIALMQRALDNPGTVIAPRETGMRVAYNEKGPKSLTREARKMGMNLELKPTPDGSVIKSPVSDAEIDLVRERGVTLYSPKSIGVGMLAGGAAGALSDSETGDEKLGRTLGGMFMGGLGGAAVGAMMPAAAKITHGPAAQKLGKWIDFAGRRQELADAAIRGGEVVEDYNRFDRLIERFAKSGHYLDRYGEQMHAAGLRPTQNPGMLRNRTKAADHITFHALAGDGLRNLEGEVVTGKSLKSVVADNLGDNPKDIEAGFKYLVAKRIVNRGADATGGNAQMFNEAADAVTELGADPRIQKFAEEWQNYTDGIMEYAIESGLWTRAQAQAFFDSDALYVPMQRVMAHINGLGLPGSTYVNVDDGVKRFVGSARAVRDPALASIEYVERIIRRADRYRVGASLFDVAEKFGDDAAGIIRHGATPPGGPQAGPGMWDSLVDDLQGTDPRKNKLIWRNNPLTGEREYATITDGSLLQSLMALNHDALKMHPEVKKVLDIVLGIPKRLLTAGTTGTPTFTLGTNILRDLPQAIAQSQSGIGLGDWAKGFKSAVTKGDANLPDLAEIRQAGLGGVSAYGHPRTAAGYKHLIAPTSGVEKFASEAGQAISAPLRAMEAVGDVSDLGPRAAEVTATVRRNANKVASGEWTQADLRTYAAHLGRKVTIDFNDRPSQAVLAVMGQYVPFFNAALQGLSTYGLAVRRNPGRALAVPATLGLAAAAGWAMKQRLGEEVVEFENDRTASERSTGIYFPITEDLTIKLPVPQEVGLLAHGVTAALDAIVDKDPNAGAYVREALLRLLPPMSPADLPLVGGTLDVMRNQRNFTNSPIESMGMRNLAPEFRRRPDTSPVWDVASSAVRGVANLPVVNHLAPEMAKNLSPVQAEHMAQRLLGTAPKNVLEAALDDPATALSGREASPRVPLSFTRHALNPLRAVVAPNAPGATQSEIDTERMDKLYGEADRSRQTMLGEDGSETPESQAWATKNPVLYGAPIFKEVRSGIDALRKERDAVVENYRQGLYNAKLARSLLDQIARREGKLYREAQGELRASGIR